MLRLIGQIISIKKDRENYLLYVRLKSLFPEKKKGVGRIKNRKIYIRRTFPEWNIPDKGDRIILTEKETLNILSFKKKIGRKNRRAYRSFSRNKGEEVIVLRNPLIRFECNPEKSLRIESIVTKPAGVNWFSDFPFMDRGGVWKRFGIDYGIKKDTFINRSGKINLKSGYVSGIFKEKGTEVNLKYWLPVRYPLIGISRFLSSKKEIYPSLVINFPHQNFYKKYSVFIPTEERNITLSPSPAFSFVVHSSEFSHPRFGGIGVQHPDKGVLLILCPSVRKVTVWTKPNALNITFNSFKNCRREKIYIIAGNTLLQDKKTLLLLSKNPVIIPEDENPIALRYQRKKYPLNRIRGTDFLSVRCSISRIDSISFIYSNKREENLNLIF